MEITASNRVEESVSRSLSARFVGAWRSRNPDAVVRLRDVGTSPPDHPTGFVSKANYTPPEARTPDMVAALALTLLSCAFIAEAVLQTVAVVAAGSGLGLPPVGAGNWVLGIVLMAVIGLVVGVIPAVRAMRLNIVDALAGR